MRTTLLAAVLTVLAFGGFDAPVRDAAAEPIACGALAKVPIANGTVTLAEAVSAGAFKSPTPGNTAGANAFAALPAFCRVTATLTPTPDSDIRVEVWLPLSGW